jgi:hypothetical protein
MPSTATKPARKTGGRTSPPSKPDQRAIFEEIRALLARYAPPMIARSDAKGGYHLWTAKGMIDARGKRKECFFAGVIPQKGYVGFYFMPVYTNPEQTKLFEPELLALLKGKSCFYVRRLDPRLKTQIRAALKSGYALYKERGWV